MKMYLVKMELRRSSADPWVTQYKCVIAPTEAIALKLSAPPKVYESKNARVVDLWSTTRGPKERVIH